MVPPHHPKPDDAVRVIDRHRLGRGSIPAVGPCTSICAGPMVPHRMGVAFLFGVKNIGAVHVSNPWPQGTKGAFSAGLQRGTSRTAYADGGRIGGFSPFALSIVSIFTITPQDLCHCGISEWCGLWPRHCRRRAAERHRSEPPHGVTPVARSRSSGWMPAFFAIDSISLQASRAKAYCRLAAEA